MRWSVVLVVFLALGCANPPAATRPERGDPPAAPEPKTPVETPPAAVAKPKRHPERVYQLDELRVIDVGIGRITIRAWLMDTPGKRQEGMMFLKSGDVADDQGMLFAFPGEQPLGFWMENTLIPLDIAYLDRERRIVSMHSMRPLDRSAVPSAKPAQYALEVKSGVLKRAGVKVGDAVRFDPTVRGD
jgi:uncharacterized membrane protein (UPF0127 family)